MRQRVRQLGITIGTMRPGPENAITDVPGVWVGHTTVIRDVPRLVRTGVTVIVPRQGRIWTDHACAGFHALSGTGEMTGVHWIVDSGFLTTPIALTNTNQVGLVRDTLVAYGSERGWTRFSSLPVVGETYDGWLSDLDAFPLTAQDVVRALDTAGPGPVEEGNVGGGTGMICHDFKGGIGTASRLVSIGGTPYVLGALVQANYGDRRTLRVDGVPVGSEIGPEEVPSPWRQPPPMSSILVLLATDAPLLPQQCRRLAERATIGLARVGGLGLHTSGDLFLAFSTGNSMPAQPSGPLALTMLPNTDVNLLFEAAAETVEESILNALCMAETMEGFQGRVARELPLDRLVEIMRKYGRLK
ncbi:MAG TPA: P1 family peptidase [Anaerolineales bacterium]|nr:P1 family peptidase [Anaerolineales bacterium]